MKLPQARRIRFAPFTAILISVFFALSAGNAFGQEPPTALGELLIARGVLVDDTPASSGLTLLSGSRLKTNADGRAVLNLSGIGRVTIGPDAELYLTFSDRKIGGELINGWTAVSAPQGVGVEIKTNDGLAIADGNQPSSLRIDVTGGNTRVEAEGGAKVTSGGKSEFVAAGEEVELTKGAAGAPVYARRVVEFSNPASVEPGAAAVFKVGLRGSMEAVTLDRTLVGAPLRTLGAGTSTVTGSDAPRLLEVAQQISPPPTPFCVVHPNAATGVVKAKAGCSVSFRVFLENVSTTTTVNVRSFFSNACFRITPASAQIAPGGGAFFTINAINCPRNAFQFAQNSMIVIQTSTCGTQTIQVEWATPCR